MGKKKIIWDDLYSDLSSRASRALIDARLKPEKLSTMSDGELTSLQGIGEVALEEIRTKYPADISKPVLAKKEEEVPAMTDSGQLPPNKRHLFRNSSNFKKVKSLVDKSKLYEPEGAIELLKKVNIARFNSTITLHLNLTERLPRTAVEFPHTTGKTKRIEIATDNLIKKIAKNELDFDVLIATPDMMPKLAKYARSLGPKGLMPNPKAGTVTTNPGKKKKELEGGKTLLKSEPKFPLMHISIGKIEQENQELLANLQAVISAVQPKKIKKATLASSMSPGIKLLINH